VRRSTRAARPIGHQHAGGRVTTQLDFALWKEITARREQLLGSFAGFRAGFRAGLQHFLAAAAAEEIYGVSELYEVEGYVGLYRFSFGPFKFIVVSNDTVLEPFEMAGVLRARIALYYESQDVQQPPVFIVEFGEARQGYKCDIGRIAGGEWHDVHEYPIAAPQEDGVRAALTVGSVIASTPAAWRRNIPWPLLAQEQEVVQPANPLGFKSDGRP
jgi:hypothetical protein